MRLQTKMTRYDSFGFDEGEPLIGLWPDNTPINNCHAGARHPGLPLEDGTPTQWVICSVNQSPSGPTRENPITHQVEPTGVMVEIEFKMVAG